MNYRQRTVAEFVELEGGPTAAIRTINEQFGVRYSVQAIMDWRNGQRQCPRRALDYMRAQVLVNALDLPDGEMASILARLSLEDF